MPQIKDDRQVFSPITSDATPTAEDLARQQLARIAREEEIKKRRQALIEQSKREAIGGKVRDSVIVEGVEMPLKDAFDRIPAQLDFEDYIQNSPLKKRALAQSRKEELIEKGEDPVKAEEQARKEQEGRQAAFDKGREAVKNQGANSDKEAQGFAVGTTTAFGARLARMAGFGQAADETEAYNAGTQAELSQHRDENYAYPKIAGAVAGAAQNTANMGTGVAASMLAGPGAGMAVMAGDFGSQEYSRAAYEGKEAGLAGGELEQYALIQGGVEAAVMPIFSKIPGLGGIEGRVLKQSIARGVAAHPTMRKALVSGAAKLTRDTAAEIVEEVTTEVLHGVTSEKLLSENVDYKAVIKDTVLQTVMMMGMTEGVQQAGRLIGSGGQPAAELPPTPEQPLPVDPAQPVEPVSEIPAPAPIPPEVEAFIQQPSRTKYDAAVKAGMPPVPDGKSGDVRKKYAAELQAQIAAPEAPPVETQEAPAETVSDDEYERQFLDMYREGVVNGQETDVTQDQQGNEVRQQGRQEGLLETPETPPGIGGMTAAAPTNESAVSSAPSISSAFGEMGTAIADNFYDAIYESIKKTGNVPPQEARSSVGKAWEQAKVAGISPEDFVAQLRGVTAPQPETPIQSPPDLASGGTTPDQSAPSLAGPVSEPQNTQEATPIATGVPSPDQPVKAADPVSKPETPRRGIVGDMLTTGEIIQTASGRPTTPFPKIATDTARKLSMTLRKAEEWLQSNAVLEAESRGDEFNALQFRNEKPGKMPKATKDSMEEYLFGEQPKVVPSILKPLVSPDIKEPWQMTREEYAKQSAAIPASGGFAARANYKIAKSHHRAKVEEAFAAGKSIPPEVLADYPELIQTPAKPRKPNPSKGRSLRSIVLSHGGISAKSLRKDYDQKQLKADGLLGMMRISGQSLDELAQILESSGDLRVPDNRTPSDYLLEQLKINADGARAEYTDAEIAARLEAEREEYERVKEFEKDRLKELLERGEAEGIRAANEGEPDEDFSDEDANEIIDTSFDFGEKAEDEALFKLEQPPKPKPKAPEFGDNENTKQGGLFDAGKKTDLPGQELLFNSDPGDLNNPKTQENKPKAEPSQEDLMEQILREELLGEKPQKERKPRTPKADTAEPKAPRKPRVEAAKKRTERTAAELKAAEDAIRKAFGSTANMGLNAEQMRATAGLVRAALNHQVSTFNEFVAYVVDTFGEPLALQMAEGIELAWRSLRRLPEYSGIDDAGKVADVLGSKATKPAKTGWDAIPGHFAQQMVAGKDYKSITEARKEAGDIIGQPIKPGTADAKTLDEAIEHGIVQAGRTIVEQGGTAVETFDKLVDLYQRQPVLGVRDTTSMEMQAYSTPVPLAFLTSHLGNVGSDTKVYEPTAGNGMLLIGTDIKNAFANELDPDRAKILRDQGFKVTTEDATTKTPPKVQVVLANPPFGKVKDENRKTIEFNVDGFRTTEVDHAIALQAMKGMEPDGYTVLILAAKGHNVKTDLDRRKAYSQGKDRPFYDALYQGYDVTQHFTVDGSLYSRQGASFPVDVIVLRPLGTVSVDQKRAAPWALMPRKFNEWGELRNAFFSDMADTSGGTGVRTGKGDNGSTDLSTRNADDVGRVSGQDENATSVVEGDVRPTESESVVSTTVDGTGGGRRGGKKSGGPRTQSGLSRPAEGKRGGEGDVSNADQAAATGERLDSGTGSDGVAGTVAAESGEVDQESHQSAYQPSSGNKTVETLIPTNLQDATRKALEAVEDEHGSIDTFVQKELGYGKNDPYFNDLSAEQVDAIALAIYAHKQGSGMIVGDMTGVGKGRVAAAMMRYADRQGLVPVFVTQTPDLFGDIYRDLADVGSDTPDNPFIALTTNDTSGSSAIDLPNGRKIQSSLETNSALLNEALTSLADGKGFVASMGGKPTKINALFTMYSQMQTVRGGETRRRDQIRQLIPNAYLILDESHNAGGTVKERVDENAPPDRAAYAREIVQGAKGVMYLSATFAKRPDVMDLYSKTDMAKAVDGDISKLSGVVQAGGLPLQQVLSAMLGESGQYIRREKSFEGIEFAKVDVGVNLEEQDKITDVFRTIRSLDAVVGELVTDMQDDLVAAGESGISGDVSTGDAGVTSTSFSSILWNAVDQMLFALKADKAADEAIAAWKAGEVPIIAVDNTMESILDEYVKANNLVNGDVVKLTFRDVLHRYLERSRWITIDTGLRTERNKKITRKERLTDAQLNVETDSGNALELFNQAYAAIEATDINAPASPIDWIRYRMQKAGMKIAEVTGRKSILVYNDNGVATLAARPRSESGTRGKQNTIRQINDGSLDGLILNRSGATGLSVHASAKVKNQKVRHMMIAQPAKNIDEFMQMLGRVNRTGQVVKPRYSLLMSDSPAELRPAAVLAKKLASLNASVTAKSKGAVGFTVTDVMNEVGGAIVQQYLIDNPEFAQALDMEMNEQDEDADASRSEVLEDVVRKATGRSAILTIAQQREFWDDITAAYTARIDELNALNSNPLTAQTMDLDAKTMSAINLFAGKPDEGPFAAPADLERIDIKSPGKPMMPSQVTQRIQDFYGIGSMDDRFGAEIKWARESQDKLTEEVGPYREFVLSRVTTDEARTSRTEMLNRQLTAVKDAMEEFSPGAVVTYNVDGIPFEGVVIGFSRKGKTGNPVAPSRWVMEVAINDPAKKLNVPVSQIRNVTALSKSLDSVLSQFESAQTTSRQKRWMGTGNLVAAYAQLAAERGKLVFYKDDQGQTKRGILMPQNFEASRFLEAKPVQFSNPADMLSFFEQGGSRLVTADGVLAMVMREPGTLMLVAPRARSRGGRYTLNRGITEAAQRDFVTVGNQMTVNSRNRQQQLDMLSAVLAISPIEARLESDREVARDILGLTKTGAKIEQDEEPAGTPDPATPAAEEPPVSELRQSANEAAAAVEAQKAENAKQNAIIISELRKMPLPVGIPNISDVLAQALAKRTIGEIRLGVKQFEAFIKKLRADFSESDILSLKPTFIRVWNSARDKFGLDEATEAGFDAAMSNTVDVDVEQLAEAAKGEPEPTPAEPADGKTYSTKNAFSAAQRQELGMEERPEVPELKREPSVDMAKAEGQTKQGSDRIDNLIAELTANPRAVSPYENDLLNFRNAELGNKLDTSLRKQIAARNSGDSVQEAIAETEASNYRSAKKALIELVLEPIGTAAGRALQARKAVIKDDYTLERLALEYEAAYGEAPSTAKLAEMQKKIDELDADKAALQKLLDEANAKYEDLEKRFKENHDAKVSKAAKKPPETAVEKTGKNKAREKISEGFRELTDMLKPGKAYSIGGVIDDASKAFVKIAEGYSELGVITLGEFLKRVGKRMGPDVQKVLPQLTAAWKQVAAQFTGKELESITNKLDITDVDTIGRVARDLHSFVIERDGLDASAEGREAAVDAVHAILVDFMPELTRDQVHRAMSGIGIYSELSQDEVEVIRRDQKAQLLSLQQIADWRKGQAPPATGQERPPVSQEQRELRRAVNEAKKAAGIVEATAGQLRSALDAAKRMAQNRIKDLTKAIETQTPISASRKLLQPDAELENLRETRDALQKLYDEAFGKRELSDEQRLNAAEKALDRAISNLEADLKAGKLYNDDTRSPLISPALEAKRAQLDALKASREEMRLQSGEAQQRSDAAYERHLLERDARLAQRIADKDFAPKEKKPERELTPAMLKLALSIQQKNQKLQAEIKKWEFDKKHIIVKLMTWGPVTTSAIIRKGLTSIDQSLIGRQGYLLGIINPAIYGKAIRKAFPSNPFEAKSLFPTEQDLFNTQTALDADPQWVRREKIGGLAVTDVHGGFNREEDNQFVPEWVNNIPGVGGSERAGSAFINTLRRLVFRSLVDKLAKRLEGQGKALSDADLKVIANFVNVSTGRGDIKKYASVINAASTVFFSPRWWISRLQWLSGQPMWHGARWTDGKGASTEVRKMIAMEMGKQLMAQAAIIGFATAALAAAFGAPGDDEEWDFYWNPASPNFGKIRVGNTMIDMTAGLGQHLSYFFRVTTGIQDGRWEADEVNKGRLTGSYLRGKLAPIPSVIGDYIAGTSMSREKFGSAEWYRGKVTPLMIQDVLEASEKEGMPMAPVISALMFFGVGARSFDERTTERRDVANEVRAAMKQGKPQAEIDELLNEHFANQAATQAKEEIRTADPEDMAVLEKIVAGEKSPELDQAIQNEKGDLALIASERLSAEDATGKKSADDDKGITTARDLLKVLAPTYEQANELYTEAYKRRNGSVTELVGEKGHKRWVVKKSVMAARRRLKAMYAE